MHTPVAAELKRLFPLISDRERKRNLKLNEKEVVIRKLLSQLPQSTIPIPIRQRKVF
jgi:hypothetical protein